MDLIGINRDIFGQIGIMFLFGNVRTVYNVIRI